MHLFTHFSVESSQISAPDRVAQTGIFHEIILVQELATGDFSSGQLQRHQKTQDFSLVGSCFFWAVFERIFQGRQSFRKLVFENAEAPLFLKSKIVTNSRSKIVHDESWRPTSIKLEGLCHIFILKMLRSNIFAAPA